MTVNNYNFLRTGLSCYLGAGSRQYCRYTKSPLGITPLKEIWESQRVNENLTSVGFEPTTHDLWIRSSNALPTELWGQYGSKSG